MIPLIKWVTGCGNQTAAPEAFDMPAGCPSGLPRSPVILRLLGSGSREDRWSAMPQSELGCA